MIILAALLLGILTGTRTFMALALVSGYALVIAPQPLIPAFGWLSEWWAFVPLAALAGLSERAKFLVVLERTDSVTWLSLRNAPEVHIVAVDQINTYDVLASDDVVFTKGAYDAFVGAGTTEKEASK